MSDKNELTIFQEQSYNQKYFIPPDSDLEDTIEEAIEEKNVRAMLVLLYHAVVGAGSVLTLAQILFDLVFSGGENIGTLFIQLCGISALLLVMLQVEQLKYERMSMAVASIYIIVLAIVVFLTILFVSANIIAEKPNFIQYFASFNTRENREQNLFQYALENRVIGMSAAYIIIALLITYWRVIASESIELKKHIADFYLALCSVLIAIVIVFSLVLLGRSFIQVLDAFVVLFLIINTFGFVRWYAD